MTIDERLDRLTERHEALTQSVELLTTSIHEQSQQIAQNSQQIHEVMEAAARLLHIAQIHEQRLPGQKAATSRRCIRLWNVFAEVLEQ